jgi:hypothetical protein
MAINGLFTQGPSIDELLSKRNQRGTALQQQLVQQAGQGSRDPMQAQAAALIGSSLGRALAGKMDGGKYEAGLQAKADAKNATQQQYLTAAGADTSAAMYDMVKLLKKDNPIAAMKMLELAKAKKKEEKDEADAKAAAIAAKVETLRQEGRDDEAAALIASAKVEAASTSTTSDQEAAALLAGAKVTGAETETEAQKAAALLVAGAKVTGAETQTEAQKAAALLLADAKVAENVTTQVTAADLNKTAGKEVYPKGSIWQKEAGGKLTWMNPPKNQKVYTTPVPAGYKLNYDEAGNVASMEPIVGSKQYYEVQASLNKTSKGSSDKRVHTNVVMDGLQQVKDISSKDSFWTPVFGPMGAASARVDGTERSTLDAVMITIESNVGFTELNAMRANSPTGGALGNVTEKELILLQNQMGALSRSQNKESFDKNLAMFEQTYNDVIHGDAQYIEEWNANNPESAPKVYTTVPPAVVPTGGARGGTGPNATQPALSAAAASFF